MLVITTLVIAFLAASLIEYLLHRIYLHNNYRNPHVQIHHKDFDGEISYSKKDTKFRTIASGERYVILNILLYSPLGIIITFINSSLGIIYFASAIIYTMWVEFVHYYFHTGKKMLLDDFKFYKLLKEHHRIHHVLYNFNYGIGSSIWDRILRTKK